VTPKSIFISGFDSHPLAPEMDYILESQEQYFQAGIDVLRKFTSGSVHLNLSSDREVPSMFAHVKNVQVNKFSGPHPAGNVGVQIHHIDPINKGQVVWTVHPVGVAQIGKLFLTGKYDASKRVAITGSEIKETGYVDTFSGACLDKLLAGNVKSDHVRYVSGNVLTGENVGLNGYLGFHHHQVTVLIEGDQEEFLGWILPSTSKLSFHRAFGLFSFLNNKKEYVLDTNTHGEHRGFVITGAFEQVMPMDILPNYLFKAIIANDYDDMESLGIYEVIEEDVALCEFIDVSKNEIQHLVREGIEMIRLS
jgi:Na+-transporting NADH:ubiquinone oxidoreductase subunit A